MDNSSLATIDSIFSTRRRFYFMVVCSQIIGIIVLILVGFLFGYFSAGFAWQSDPDKEFNYHPVLMTLGLIFFYGDAMLVYRIFRVTNKMKVKILHVSLLALSLIVASIGLKAVFDSHNLTNPPKNNLFSIHGWIGLITVILFGLQWVCGFVSFLFPKLSETWRKDYMPSHKFWGNTIFVLGVVAVHSGITEYSIFRKLYSNEGLSVQKNIINVFGIFVVTFAIIILYLVTSPEYERPADRSIPYILLTDMESKACHVSSNRFFFEEASELA